MTRVSKKWSLRRFDARARADAIGSADDVGFPVNLAALGAKCRVQRIIFQPLIVHGALGILSNGFEIFVQCESFEADQLNELFQTSPDGKLLPAHIRNRARFTIAHEIAHTLFYDSRTKPPTRSFPITSAAQTKALEQACNQAAAALLLPKPMLRHLFGNYDFRDPNALSTIADKALVAKFVVIIRIPDVDSVLQPLAILATVKHWQGCLHVDNVWRHYSFKSRFPMLRKGAILTAALNESPALSDLSAFGGYLDQTEFEVPFGSTSEMWTIVTERHLTRGAKGTFVVSLFRSDDFPSIETPKANQP